MKLLFLIVFSSLLVACSSNLTGQAYDTVARLNVTTAGASVRIDGSYVGVSPLFITIPPGTHALVLSKAGYPDTSFKINATAGNTVLIAYQFPPLGKVNISSVPLGATVIWDGKAVGLTPLVITTSYGPHVYSFSKTGYIATAYQITVAQPYTLVTKALALAPTCNDSDGFNVYTYGSVNAGGRSVFDICNSESVVREAVCLGPSAVYRDYTCPYKCSRGVCIQAPPAVNFSCEALVYKGSPKNMLNFVFIAENYSSSQEFRNTVDAFLGLSNKSDPSGFLNYAPYNQFVDSYNIFTVFAPNKDFGCTSTINAAIDATCNSQITMMQALGQCAWINESDVLIVLSNKSYRSHATHYFPVEVEKVRLMALSVSSGEKTSLDNDKKAFLHEMGHALGDLSDEYIDGANKYYLPEAPLGALNIDAEGCPKWCSGEINTSQITYGGYAAYKACIAPLRNIPQNESAYRQCLENAHSYMPEAMNKCIRREGSFEACLGTVYNTSVEEFVAQDLHCGIADNEVTCDATINLNLGSACVQETGCYWLAGAANGFRSLPNSLMRNHVTSSGAPPPPLVPLNEGIARASIQEKISQRSAEVKELHIELREVTNHSIPYWWVRGNIEQQPDPKPYPFKLKFTILNQDGISIALLHNERNYVIDSPHIINRNLSDDTYELYFAYYLDTKHGQTEIRPSDYLDIPVDLRYDHLVINKTVRVYVYNQSYMLLN